MHTPPKSLLTALTYLRALLASKDPAHWEKLKCSIKTTSLWDLPIAPRWRHILNEDWTTIPDTPSPLTLDRATRQHSIKSALSLPPSVPTEKNVVQTTNLTERKKEIPYMEGILRASGPLWVCSPIWEWGYLL